jgi:hypothetical protein
MAKISLGQHLPLHDCQTVAEFARKLVPWHEAMGAPGQPPDPDEPTVEPTYYDPTGGDDGGPAIITPGIPGPAGEDGKVVVGEGGIIVGGGGGGEGQGHTAGAAMAIATDPSNSSKDIFKAVADNSGDVFLGYTNTDIGDEPTNAQQMTIKWTDMPGHVFDKDQVLSHTKGGVSRPRWVKMPFIAYCLADERVETDADTIPCLPVFWFMGPPDDEPALLGAKNVFEWSVNEGAPVIVISWDDPANNNRDWYPLQALAACPPCPPEP